MKKLYLALILGLFLISLASSQQGVLGTFKQGEDINLIQVCSSCTYSNISTIKLANGTLVTFNEQMQKDGTFYNWTLNSSYTTSIGEYKVNGVGDLDGAVTIWVYSFDVTKTGSDLTTAQSGLSIGIMISIILLTFFFGFLSYKFLDKEKTFPFGLFFLLIAFILAIYTLYLGTLFSQDFLLESTNNIQSTIFTSILYSLVGISFIGLLFLILKVLKEIKERKSLIKYGSDFDSETKQYR